MELSLECWTETRQIQNRQTERLNHLKSHPFQSKHFSTRSNTINSKITFAMVELKAYLQTQLFMIVTIGNNPEFDERPDYKFGLMQPWFFSKWFDHFNFLKNLTWNFRWISREKNCFDSWSSKRLGCVPLNFLIQLIYPRYFRYSIHHLESSLLRFDETLWSDN